MPRLQTSDGLSQPPTKLKKNLWKNFQRNYLICKQRYLLREHMKTLRQQRLSQQLLLIKQHRDSCKLASKRQYRRANKAYDDL